MPTKIIDYSFSRPSPAAIRAANIGGVLRYICIDKSKCISVPEATALHADKITIGFVYEDGQNDFAGGAAIGRAKAAIAKPVLGQLGVGLGRPVYAAVDLALPSSQYLQTWDGIQAFAGALGRPPACYGPRPFLRWLNDTHGVLWLWELGSASFNTGLEPKIGKRIQQLVGGDPISGAAVDYDLVYETDWGQWPSPQNPPAPVPVPTPPVPPSAHEYAAKRGLVMVDRAEAEMCVFPQKRLPKGQHLPEIAWYTWDSVHHLMDGHSDPNIPLNTQLWAFQHNLDAAGIPHAGA